jgi:hypothetical protein
MRSHAGMAKQTRGRRLSRKSPLLVRPLVGWLVNSFSTLMMGQTLVPKRWSLNSNQTPGNHP